MNLHFTTRTTYSWWWSIFVTSLMVAPLVVPHGGLAQPTVKEVLEQQSKQEMEAGSISGYHCPLSPLV